MATPPSERPCAACYAGGAGGFGRMIDGAGAPLDSFDVEEARGLVRAHGYLLLRGFRASPAEFEGYAKALATRPMVIAGRALAGTSPLLRLVDPGEGAIGVHAENSFAPVRPDLLGFFCERPSPVGGATTLCDGVRLFGALSAETRAHVEAHRVCWHGRADRASLRDMFGTDDPAHLRAIFAALSARSDGVVERLEVDLDDEGASYRYASKQIHDTARGVAFSDTGAVPPPFVPYRLERAPLYLTREDGEPMPSAVCDELVRLKDGALAEPHAWAPGDALFVDNWSVMHGRAAFSGPRRILTCFGYADWLRPRGRAHA